MTKSKVNELTWNHFSVLHSVFLTKLQYKVFKQYIYILKVLCETKYQAQLERWFPNGTILVAHSALTVPEASDSVYGYYHCTYLLYCQTHRSTVALSAIFIAAVLD